jgi:hypothetical protein
MTDENPDVPSTLASSDTGKTTASNPKTEGDEMEGGKRSAWMSHVKKTMRANKGKSLSQVLKMAAKTYKKGSAKKTARKTRKGKSRKFLGMFGGATPTVAENAGSAQAGGRRRRKH